MENSFNFGVESNKNTMGLFISILDSAGGANPIFRLMSPSTDLDKMTFPILAPIEKLYSLLLVLLLFLLKVYKDNFDLSEFFQTRKLDQILHFKLAANEVQDVVRTSFNLQKTLGTFEKKIDLNIIKRVTHNNLHDLSLMGINEINGLAREGFSHIEELSVVTSGAGLWSRGGGTVKALVPYNIARLLGSEFQELSCLGKIVAAKSCEEILKVASFSMAIEAHSNIERKVLDIKSRAIAKIKKINSKTIFDFEAINSIDMKFVNLACAFIKTKKYVSFDIWTSEQTHQMIQCYVEWLRDNLYKKIFHHDPVVNNKIIFSLEKYFKKSRELGETHLFGYQEGLYALDVKTGVYNFDSPTIGKGAGSIIEYLENSGRMNVLRSYGKKTIVFENIEVVSDYAPLFASHRRSRKPVSVVLVPQKNGYIGGSPLLIKKPNGEWNIELHEQCVLNEKFKNNNDYFNTNTIFFSTEVKTPETISFELKDQNTIARAKLNMGDITFNNSTHGIGGRLGHDQEMVEYENFKSFDEYGENGEFYIRTFQNKWKEMILE
jgi:hypothetical protein